MLHKTVKIKQDANFGQIFACEERTRFMYKMTSRMNAN